MASDLLLSRRGLLRAGLVGSVAVSAGGLLACARRASRPPGVAERAALSPPGEEVMRAVIPVVLGPLLPRAGPARAQALDAGAAALDDYLASLSLPLQQEARDVFDTLDLLPVRVLLLGTRQRWQEAPPESIEAFLRSARHSRFLLARRIYAFLQSLAVLAWFDQPSAWPEIGYPGPPIGPYAAGGPRP
jgi:hypothetical protein